ncbi:hypothetical protein H2198_004189 [Neophaeococcomyces mojaviensis]|uniref:Uncharacterized protein n=1 Tax=Neophaeococcomyces mojaviensis TaxID=3383035 RepID=A0ACC3A9B8_9EURO|nr:hypothetical protein H2198_004189 [Knufia sp. JES_112]
MGFLYSQFFVTPKIPTTPLNGQTLIITGSNTGLGFEAARHIARLNPTKLILAVRNLEAGAKARDEIIATTSCDPSIIEVWRLDLASFSSVLAFADRVSKDLDRLDGISLNAGVQTVKFELVEGFERTVTINVISTFLLALAVLPKLRETARRFNIKPRLSIVSSETHAWTSFVEKNTPEGQSILATLSDPNTKTMMMRYMTSKLMEVLLFRHLAPLITAQQTSPSSPEEQRGEVIVNILNPGFCYSDLVREEGILMKTMQALLARTREMGGRPIAAGLIAGPESNGMYMHDGVVDQAALSHFVLSEEGEKCAERLWLEVKEALEGVRKGVTLGL